jgi:hypothetical protein
MTTNWAYMPILKWKRGERAALSKLDTAQWEGIVPLLELGAIEAAPDTAALSAALPGYIARVADEIIKSIPADQAIAIDTQYVSTGFARQLDLLLAVLTRLAKAVPNSIIPVIHAGQTDAVASLSATRLLAFQSFAEIMVRLDTDSFQASQVDPVLASVAKYVKRKQLHLMLDQFALVDKQYGDCFTSLQPYLAAAAATSCASVTVAGGSFPVNLTGKKQGVTDLPRVEWKIWQRVQAVADYKRFRFADYTVSNPKPMDDQVDPTKVNPSIAIRYTSDDFWRLYKGAGFKGAPGGTLMSLSKLLTTDAIYGGQHYSFGDKKYMEYASGAAKNGIPWTWRRDATNRHIVHTIKQL